MGSVTDPAGGVVRPVVDVVDPQWVSEGAGVRLRRSIGGFRLDYLDPFLLLDHFESDDPSDYLAGFPMHPHRGIETVTYMLDGEVDHKDTLGNAGTIGPGDVQWMTAGGGIMHEEMPRPRNGRMGGFQLWVNLPAARKMTRPRYQEVPAATIPMVERPDGVRVRIVAGSVDGVEGPVREIVAEPTCLDVTVPSGATYVHTLPAGENAFAYVFRGAGVFGPAAAASGADPGSGAGAPFADAAGGRPVDAPRLLVFGHGDSVAARAAGDHLRFLLVAGRPLDEPVARYGPFVMTTREEIERALADLRAGTFVWQE
jgi:redox-sensitive bicupin YhaK (pirin superfamily)